jgi:NAD(P)-dependent dehydrogenase (short-subunit alcohol dehydrogenase family)
VQLAGAVALVTGASRGVGRAIALALADAGADVACAARATDATPLKLPGTIDATVREVERRGRRGLAVPTDLARAEQVEAMIGRTIEAFGRLDILVNNAAITFAGDIDLPIKRWDLIMDVNLRAPVLAIKAALPGMISRGIGAVLNVSSAAAVLSVPGLMAYGVSKAGLERLTVGLADQVRPHGIAVNCFRIDVPIASEGFVYNAPDLDKSDWEPTEVGAEGVLWMLAQPSTYTGHVVGITELRREYGVAQSRRAR